MRAHRAGALLAAAILTLGVAACGTSGTTPSTTPTSAGASGTTTGSPTTVASGAAGTIAIHNFMFQPGTVTANVGDTITVTNQDDTDHSLTAVDGSFDTGVFSSGSKTITMTKAGTFTIHCRIHSFMTGTITVK